MSTVGALMIATPFILLFLWSLYMIGTKETAVLFGSIVVLFIWLLAAARLFNGE